MRLLLIITSLLTSTPIGYDNTYVIDCDGYNTFINQSFATLSSEIKCYVI